MIRYAYKKTTLAESLKIAFDEGYIHELELPGCFGLVADHLFRCFECPLLRHCEDDKARSDSR